ncbi:MAG: hypothetical protein ACP5D0_04960 [Hydrogenovibrio sp.]
MHYYGYLYDDHLVLVTADRSRKSGWARVRLPWNSDAIRTLLEPILKPLKAPATFSLILAFSDEQIDMDWVPALLPWEKPAYVKRCHSRFDKGEWAHSHWVSVYRQNAVGRREQRLVTVHQPQSDKLKNLLDVIAALGGRVGQVYSYVFLLELYFWQSVTKTLKLSRKRMQAPFIWTLREDSHRFRQWVFVDGNFILSRWVVLDTQLDETAIAEALVAEVSGTIRYLYNQKWVAFDREIGQVFVEAVTTFKANPLPFIEVFKAHFSVKNWDMSKPYFVSDTLPIGQETESAFTEFPLLTQVSDFLKTKAPPSFYQNGTWWERVPSWPWSRLAWAAAGLALVVALTMSVRNGFDYMTLAQQERVLTKQLTELQQHKVRVQKAINLQYDAQDMKATVEFFDHLKHLKRAHFLEHSLVALSQALAGHPTIQLKQITWSREAVLDRGWMAATVSCDVVGAGSFESLLQQADAFQEAVRQIDGFDEVAYQQEPFNRQSDRALSVEGRLKPEVQHLPFTLAFRVEVMSKDRLGAVKDKNDEGAYERN